jgi:hypothetical protein
LWLSWCEVRGMYLYSEALEREPKGLLIELDGGKMEVECV